MSRNKNVTVTVSGAVGSGKSAVCGEIEILFKALKVPVTWEGGVQEKNLTNADWIAALELYKPEVTIIEEIERPVREGTALYNPALGTGVANSANAAANAAATAHRLIDVENRAQLYDAMLDRAKAAGFSGVSSALDAAIAAKHTGKA